MTDNKDLEIRPEGGVATIPSEAQQRMVLLREAMTNPDVDPAKALGMAELMCKLEDRDLRAQFNRDKVAAINSMPQVFQDGTGHHSIRYAKFESLHRKIRPILDQHNLTIRFDIGSTEKGGITVTPILEHENGQNERGGTMVAPPDQGGSKSPVQAVASTASYLKRHSMKAMLNIIEGGDDDDGTGGATAESHLTAEQREMIESGRSAAMDGVDSYATWFKQQSPARKGWLSLEPYHDQNKKAAEAADKS